MLFFMGALGMNFGIFIGVMSVAVFHEGASEFGVLVSVMAVGSVAGAPMVARGDGFGPISFAPRARPVAGIMGSWA